MTGQLTATDLMAPIQDCRDEEASVVDLLQIQQRISEEAAKRLRDEGYNQFVDLSLDDRFKSLLDDPWVEKDTVKDIKTMFPDNRCHVLIMGAGFGGLINAIRLIQAGTEPEDIRIIDGAGGFGGTWYWNRYPGISCDIESYLYLPLLEETGYIPRHRYSEGEEIREYINLLAQKWGLEEIAVFQTKAQKLQWEEGSKEWRVELVQNRSGEEPQTLEIHAQFVVMSNGPLHWPKIPGVPGILDYQGDIFHTSRWDYGLTGGSPADHALTKLRGKRVAIVGTGATAAQIVPKVARWAEQLYVVQRTPASVDTREQRGTDPEWFRNTVASSKGWQRERLRNLHQHLTLGKQPEINLCDDEWTRMPALVGISGNIDGPTAVEEIPAYLEKLHAIDLPRLQRLHKRVETVVQDQAVAERLKAWYPSWCKRPVFHDEYLSTFNRENVTLVDTNGKGLDHLTKDSIVVADKSYPVDIIIFATGFRAPFIGSPADKANVNVVGRDGVSMSEEWTRNGPSTLHGVLDCNFPNLFLSGPWQASLSPNYVFTLDFLAQHSAHILTEAKRKAEGKPFAVTSTKAAAEEWSMQLLMRSFPGAAILSCTPSYFNVEGELARAPPEQQTVIARSGVWGWGIESFVSTVEKWYEKNDMQGIEVKAH